jgi:hypothetical protein
MQTTRLWPIMAGLAVILFQSAPQPAAAQTRWIKSTVA